jgi:hypothetical protein
MAYYQNRHVTVTIAINTALSTAISPNGEKTFDIQTPAVWTAADIAFEVSNDGTTFYPLYSSAGARIKNTTVATGAAQVYNAASGAEAVMGWAYFRLVSINTGTGANEVQAAARTVVVILR